MILKPKVETSASTGVKAARHSTPNNVPLNAPHTPWLPTKEFEGKSTTGPYGDFVVHVFDDKARRFYDLERLWREGRRRDLSADDLTKLGSLRAE